MKSNGFAAPKFNPLSAMDYLPLPQLRQVQLERMQYIVRRAYDHVTLFRQRMKNLGVTPADIQTLEDVARLPFTEKNDLREAYPFGLFASPMEEIVRLHASSGTTGKPIVVAYTQEDLNDWTRAMHRSFAACGLHRGTSSRTPTATACSRAGWEPTTGRKPWAPQ